MSFETLSGQATMKIRTHAFVCPLLKPGIDHQEFGVLVYRNYYELVGDLRPLELIK